MSIAHNLNALKKELPANVTLVAVSKTKPAAQVREAYDAGHRDFGENYVQELVQKHAELPADIRWHFIGHLQSNKVKFIAPFVYLIHGVESLKLLKEIAKQAVKNNRVIRVLLQLHVAKEETKFGLTFEECRELLAQADKENLQGVKISGLMAMASNTQDVAQVAREFRSVYDFSRELSRTRADMEILSYGMSGDYRLAVANGSNMVRIGSLIFGERL